VNFLPLLVPNMISAPGSANVWTLAVRGQLLKPALLNIIRASEVNNLIL
jgi:hypothetical protein